MTLFKLAASSEKKIADFSEQCSRCVSSVVDAYWNPWTVGPSISTRKSWPNFHRLSRTWPTGKTFIDYHYTFQHVLHLSWLFGPALKEWNFTLTFLLSAITSAFASLKTFSLSAWSRSLAKFARWSCSFKSLTSRWWRDLIVISSVFASAAYKKRTSERRINSGFIQKRLDFQGQSTRNIISQIVQKCIFTVYSNKTLRL